MRKINVFGDSILKGVQYDSEKGRYCIKNNIDTNSLSGEFSLDIENCSKFGCTVTKGSEMLENYFAKNKTCDAVVMDFGGNDCDFNWKEISEDPYSEHLPNTPIELFKYTYINVIHLLKSHCIKPMITNLPPIMPQRFFDWFCRDLNKENILMWLGGIDTIYRYQENYSRIIEKIALEENVPLIDLRGAFLSQRRIDSLICEDGIHPNTAGQKIITSAFREFASEQR